MLAARGPRLSPAGVARGELAEEIGDGWGEAGQCGMARERLARAEHAFLPGVSLAF